MQSPGGIKTISNEQAMLLLGILNHQKVEQSTYTSSLCTQFGLDMEKILQPLLKICETLKIIDVTLRKSAKH
jgi:hypothetical protein